MALLHSLPSDNATAPRPNSPSSPMWVANGISGIPGGATASASDSVVATGAGTALTAYKALHLSLDFTTGSFVGTAVLTVSHDGGSTYKTVTDAQGNQASWIADLETVWPIAVAGEKYRWNVTRTSGTLAAGIYQ